MLNINWVDKVSNNEILQQVNTQNTIIDTIKTRKLQQLGHTLRHESSIQVVFEGIIPGKKEKDDVEQTLYHKFVKK